MTPTSPWLTDRAFVAYAIMALAIAVNLVFLWMYSGLVRGKTKTTLNPEDAAQFGTKLVETNPPPVAHALRAYDNALASSVPFLAIGLLYVLAGANVALAEGVFGVYAVARWLHSFAYLKRLQPWRTGFFLIGMLCLTVLVVALAWRLVQGA